MVSLPYLRRSDHEFDVYHLIGLGDIPVLSLTTCDVLEKIFVTAAETKVSFVPIVSTLSSVTSLRFQRLILELQTGTAERDPDHIQVDLTDRLSHLDEPLSQIARAVRGENREVSLVLLGQDPEFLAQAFVDFQSLGPVWAGEEVREGEYIWTVSAPKNVKRCPVKILDRLFRRKTLD